MSDETNPEVVEGQEDVDADEVEEVEAQKDESAAQPSLLAPGVHDSPEERELRQERPGKQDDQDEVVTYSTDDGS